MTNNKDTPPVLPPQDQLDFWRFSIPLARPILRVLCVCGFLFPFALIALIVFERGWSGVSLPAVCLLLMFPVGSATAFALSYRRDFYRYYRSLSLFVYLSTIGVFFAIAAVAQELGRRAALQMIPVVAMALIITPFRLRVKFVLSAIAYGCLAAFRILAYGDPVIVQVGVSAILTAVTALVCGFHEQSNLAAYETKLRLEREQRRSEGLLRKIYPEAIYQKIKDQPEIKFVQHYPEVSILFADLVGFTPFCAERTPDQVVSILDEIISRLDASCAQVGAVKIKTVGDAYLAVTGLPEFDPDHARKIADLALEFRAAVFKYATLRGVPLQLRIGIHTGSVVAGIIGRTTSHFDLWGDTVNVAARLEKSGIPGQIQVSEQLASKLRSHFSLVERGVLHLKGKGSARTYLLEPLPLPTSEVRRAS